MLSYLAPHQTAIRSALIAAAQQELTACQQADNQVGSQLWSYLLEMLPAGKLLRGALVRALSQALAADVSPAQTLVAAVALEFFNAGLLIHDDVQDQDRQRRGQPSLFARYEQLAQEQQFAQSTHWGNSMAINGGDICLFMAQRMVLAADMPDRTKVQLSEILAGEAIQTGYGQLGDVTLAARSIEAVSLEQINQVHIAKTAHYTFCLPFRWAAVLTDQPATVQQQLTELGEEMGVLFQMHDDELGIWGQPGVTGKSNLSDMREAKKTWWYWQLMQRASASEKVRLSQLFGDASLDESAGAWVRQLMTEYHLPAEFAVWQSQQAAVITHHIEQLPVVPAAKSLLTQLAAYVVKRDK